MAIDTQEKRMSAATAGRPWMRQAFPVAATDEQARMSRGMAYGGNALTPPVAGLPPGSHSLLGVGK